MRSDVLEEGPLATAPAVRPSRRAPRAEAPPRRRAGAIATVAATFALPVATACALHGWTSAVPFGISEEAAVVQRDGMLPVARAIAAVLGSAPATWRLFGTIALALFGTALAAITLRLTRSRFSALQIGGVAATHAAAVSAAVDVRGSFAVLALAVATVAWTTWGRGAGRRLAAAALLMLAVLVAPTAAPFSSFGDALRLAFNRAPDASLAALLLPATVITLFLTGIARRGVTVQARVVACAAALAFAAMGVGATSRHLATMRPERAEAQRFLARLDAVPPVAGDGARELVLDLPPWGARLESARPLRHLVPGIAGLAGSRRVRVLDWAPPVTEGLMGMGPCDLAAVIEADVDPTITLLAPGQDAQLAAECAADEPEFRFRIAWPAPEIEDLRIVVLAETPERTRVIVRGLERATVRRDGVGLSPELAWRPGWRPMAHCDRELRWEDGEVCPRGASFWWTIAVADASGTRMAPLRRAFVLP